MNYCVSGRSGFIGQAVSKYLIEREDEVYGIPRTLNTVEGILQYFRVTRPERIIHLATYGNHYERQKDYKQMVDTNIIGTYNLLEAAKQYGCKFYNITASVVSGEFYYATKRCAEVLSQKYGAINVRVYSAYGPGEANHKFIPTVISHLNSGETMEVDLVASHAWIYIDDLVDAFFKGETELGGPSKITNQEIIAIMEAVTGKKLNYVERRVRDYDNDNWSAPTGVCYTKLSEGLMKTYEYYSK